MEGSDSAVCLSEFEGEEDGSFEGEIPHIAMPFIFLALIFGHDHIPITPCVVH